MNDDNVRISYDFDFESDGLLKYIDSFSFELEKIKNRIENVRLLCPLMNEI